MPRTASSSAATKGTYLDIAAQLQEEILSGRRAPGEQLPTQRQLAKERNVTQGTINRAYAELARQGLVSGEIGRGSFVLDISRSISPAKRGVDLIDMAANKPATAQHTDELKRAMQRVARRGDLSDLLGYQPDAGAWKHREAASRWLATFNVHASAERVALTVGAQQGNAAALLALTRPGDVVLVEEFTYTGMKALAHALDRRLAPVAMDDEGLVPEALREAAKKTRARCLYCMPGLHNPTNAIMSSKRRQAIAALADELDLQVIEDGVYDFMVDRTLMPLVSLIPGRTVYLSSLSKSVAPGLRLGMVVAPEPILHAIAHETRSLLWTAPPLMAEVGCDWMDTGIARKLADAHRAECAFRVSIARRVLGDLEFRAQDPTAHLWLKLPAPWTSADFVAAARQQGVALAPTDAFSARQPEPRPYVRVGLASPEAAQQMMAGLQRVATALRLRTTASLSIT